MTYREKLEKFKTGELSEQEEKEIRQDIEKYEAISEYLFDDGDIPEFKDLFNGQSDMDSSKEDTQFVTMVNHSIRKAFRRLGLGILAATIAAVLLIQFCLPPLVSAFYYNPAGKSGEYQTQMSLDMAVYSELLLPCKKRDNVAVDAKGYGKYDISIQQNISYTRNFTSVSGEITRGKLKLYDNNILNPPTGNCFAWFQADEDTSKALSETLTDSYNMCAAGPVDQALETLKSLNDTDYYIGYVSLDKMMDYESFKRYIDLQEDVIAPWCAVKTEDANGSMFRASNIGFSCSLSSSSSLEWDTEKYPELILWSENSPYNWEQLQANLKTEEYMKTHFVSLLNYLSAQGSFLDMMDLDKNTFTEAAKYVQDNGLTVYGFAAVMNKETALKLMEQEEVYEIYIQDLK